MMTRGRTLRLRMYAEDDESGSNRAIDIAATTQLNVVAQALRAVSNRTQDGKQYRMEIGDEVYGNPPGRSQQNVRRGTQPLEEALGKRCSFRLRSDLRRKKGHLVHVEHVFPSIWAPEDHPLLVDVAGEMPGGRKPPTGMDRPRKKGAPAAGESRDRDWERLNEIVRHYLLELGMIRDRRRGPIRSHNSGRRGWRDRWHLPRDLAAEARHAEAEAAIREFADTGHWYTPAGYGHYEQRPCLIEQIGLERITWCAHAHCPGCRGNHKDDDLFVGSEVWTTTRGEPLEAARRQDDVLVLHEKPAGRVTVRVSHPCGDRTAVIESVKSWKRRVDALDLKRLGIWVAPSGRSWRGVEKRTPVLWQPAELSGPPGWWEA